MRDLAAFFDNKAKWSLETFGPGSRYAGVVKHIRKELKEIEANPADLIEWIDVTLLAMDGAWRAAGADGAAFVKALTDKDATNRVRQWPDWRTLAQGEVSEHVRTSGSSREALLMRLVGLSELGMHDHTGVVNCLYELLDTEAASADPTEEWVLAYRALP